MYSGLEIFLETSIKRTGHSIAKEKENAEPNQSVTRR
tara:strand:- start:450 stop:560 length:111 start_codon:yes stop_codon:yes gene_type:complete